MFKNIFKFNTKLFIVCVMVSTTFLVNRGNVQAYFDPSKATTVSTNCESCKWYCLSSHVCCESSGGKVYGHASGATTITTENYHLSPSAILAAPRDNIYIGLGGDDTTENYGIAYINVPVGADSITHQMLLFFEADDVIIYPVTYEEWTTSIKAKTFAECVAYILNSYTGTKAVVYPNPTSSDIAISLTADYINSCKVQSVTYQLYNSSQALLATLTPSNVVDIVNFPANDIITAGVYFIKCNVTKQNTALNEEFIVQFIK